jgi:kumamolisin
VQQEFCGMISHFDSWSLTISADAPRLNCSSEPSAAAQACRTGLFAAALMLGLSACSAAAPRPPQPAPGKVFVETRLDPKIRAVALAGGHSISPDFSMRVHVYLTPVDPAEFNRTLAATEDPHSPTFGHHLTHEELKRFERPISEYDEIEHWLGSYGIKVLSADPAAFVRTIRVEGTAREFEEALNIRINQSANGSWFANMSNPQIPENFNGIIGGFAGLDDLSGYAGGPGEIVQ